MRNDLIYSTYRNNIKSIKDTQNVTLKKREILRL